MTERREAVLRAIVQSTPVALIALDAQGIVHVWNRAAEELFGWSAADIVGGASPFAVGDLIAQVIGGDAVTPRRARYTRRDGTALDVQLRCGPLRNDADRVVGAVLVLTEVTDEQRRSEHELEETRAALARAEALRLPAPAAGERTASAIAEGDALLDAIKRDQLQLFFQPIVRLADAQCVGAEALVRWQDPDRGLVSADAILAIAERFELGDDLGAWMLERAITQAARWQLEQAGFRVSIGLPARALTQTGLAVLIGALLRREGVPPESIDVEVAQEALDDDTVRAAIEEVRGVGVRVLVRGWEPRGSAVDGVKPDCAFVDRAAVERAHAEGLRVVAAGVDTESQLARLLESGCDDAQGNFFAPPQPASDLRTLMSPTRRWRPRGSHLMRRA